MIDDMFVLTLKGLVVMVMVKYCDDKNSDGRVVKKLFDCDVAKEG